VRNVRNVRNVRKGEYILSVWVWSILCILAILKLFGLINISWWWITFFLWVPITVAVTGIALIICLIILALMTLLSAVVMINLINYMEEKYNE